MRWASSFTYLLEVCYRTFPVVKILFGKQQRRLTDEDFVAIRQGGLFRDYFIIDGHAVSALHIKGVVPILLPVISNLKMLPRN